MAQIYNPDEIIKTSDNLEAKSKDLKKLIEQMRGIITEMGTVWQSPAQKTFASRFSEIEPQLTSFATTISSFAERAKAQAEAVRTSEVDPV